MEEALLGPFINKGSDNVFANQTGININNIERIDLIFDNGLVTPSNALDEGFIILERGGNDLFYIAPILSLNSNGEPATFGQPIQAGFRSASDNDWGLSSFSFTAAVLNSPTPDDPLVQTDFVLTAQAVAGIYFSYNNLGLVPGQTFFGYSLAGGDVPDNPANWPDATGFPTNTCANCATGGLDLISGGSASSRNPFEGSYTLTGGECWRMLSSPTAQTYGSLLNGLWTQGVPGASFSGGSPNVLVWNTSTSAWVTPTSMQTAIPVGTGVLVSVFSDDNFDGNPEVFPKP